MKLKSRREAAQIFLGALAWSGSTIDQEIEIFPDEQIGVIHPELHGQFAESPGNYSVDKKSAISNLEGFRELAVAYLRVLTPPVLRGESALFCQLIGALEYSGGPALPMNPLTEESILRRRHPELVVETNARTAVAAGFNLNVLHRQADKVAVALAPLESLVLVENEICVRTGVYYAFLLAKPHRGRISVKANPPQANSLELSISASRHDNSFTFTIVNPRPDRNVRVRCRVRGYSVASASATTLFDQKLDVQVRSEEMLLTLPALSVTTVLAVSDS